MIDCVDTNYYFINFDHKFGHADRYCKGQNLYRHPSIIDKVYLLHGCLMDRGAKERLATVLRRVQGDACGNGKAERTERELALQMGVALATVQNWLGGAGLPNIENLGIIAQEAGMTVQELYQEHGFKASPFKGDFT